MFFTYLSLHLCQVARDPSGGGGNANPEDPIEIPPPRPKRKPMHPYPRKIVVQSPIKENSTTRSLSPDLSLQSDEENCSPDSALCLNPTAGSPKSVLSLMGSETGGSTGSSPVSSGSGSRNEISLERSESNTFSEAVSVSVPISESPVVLYFPINSFFSKFASLLSPVSLITSLLVLQKLELFSQESSTEEVPSRFLKLFGRSYLISDPNRSTEKTEEKVESVVPQWPFYGGLHFPDHEKQQSRNPHEDQGSANGTGIGAGEPYLERKETSPEPPVFKWKPSSRSAFSQLRVRTDKSRRGFVPYQRIIVAEEEKSEEKRTYLCL